MLLTGCGSSGDWTETSTTTDSSEYVITVINENGNPVSSASVTLDGSSQSTDSYGTAAFAYDKDDSSAHSLTVTASDYRDFSNDSFYFAGSGKSIVRLNSEGSSELSLKKATFIEGDYSVDALNTLISLTRGNGDTFSLTTTAQADSSDIAKYELIQEQDGNANVIATSTDGNFSNVSVDSFEPGSNIYILVTDNSGAEKSTALRISVSEQLQDVAAEISFGDVSAEIPEDTPLLSEFDSIDINLPNGSISYSTEREDGKTTVNIGINADPEAVADSETFEDLLRNMSTMSDDDSDELAEDFDKIFNDYGNALESGSMLTGFKNDTDTEKGIEIIGALSGTVNQSGKVTEVQGYLAISAEASAEFSATAVVVYIPVTFSVEISGGAELSSPIILNLEAGTLNSELDVAFTEGITGKAGVGVKYLNAGVFGSAELEEDVTLPYLGNDLALTAVTLSGSFGVYALAGPFENDLTLIDGDYPLFPRSDTKAITKSLNSLSDMSSYSLIAAGTKTSSKAQAKSVSTDLASSEDSVDYTTATEDGVELLAGELGTLEDSKIMAFDIAKAGDTAVIVYEVLDDDSSSDTYGREILMYRVLTEDGWSSANKLTNATSYEFEPDLCSDGTDIYLAYTTTNETLGSNDLSTEDGLSAAKAFDKTMDIVTAKFNASTGVFEDFAAVSDTDLNEYDHSPRIYSDGSCVYAAWIANEDGDFTCNNETNAIKYATCSGSSWGSAQTASAAGFPVTELALGDRSGTASIAYNRLTATYDSSTADSVTYYGAIGGSTTKLTDHTLDNLTFTTLPGESASALIGYEDENLCTVSTETSTVWENNVEGLSNYYQVLEDCIVYLSYDSEGRTDVMVTYYNDETSTWTSPVSISGLDKSAISLRAVDYGEGIILSALGLDGSDDEVDINLYQQVFFEKNDLELKSLDYDVESVTADEPYEVSAKIVNNGTTDISAVNMEISKDGETYSSVEYAVNLEAGASTEISSSSDGVSTFVPDEIDTYEVTVTPVPETEETDEDNNTKSLELTYSELDVSSECIVENGYTALVVKTENLGNRSTSADVKIFDMDDPSTILETVSTGTLDVGEKCYNTVKLSDDWFSESGEVTLGIYVENGNDDLYPYNNTTLQYVRSSYSTYNITYNLTYDGHTGTNSEDNASTYDSTKGLELEDATAPSGYAFTGWYTDEDCSEDSLITEIAIDTCGDLTLYAKYEELNLETHGSIAGAAGTYTYTGSEIEPYVSVYYDGEYLSSSNY
ncbi:MAG: InlB B-repeat-containing protein, partial [Eubacterium sp.]|nr:InlB B-repeat-containing protein [Eubacterium sp.]